MLILTFLFFLSVPLTRKNHTLSICVLCVSVARPFDAFSLFHGNAQLDRLPPIHPQTHLLQYVYGLLNVAAHGFHTMGVITWYNGYSKLKGLATHRT